jgi:4-amino-4-deoxy-L-arabinose transferase-like glycosyltransferase
VIVLVAAIYLPRLTTLTVRGEESRWARVAQEMLDTGDWIVPRQQGQPFADRPPLGSWSILATSLIVGEVNLVAVRLPSVVAVLLTVMLIYWYVRHFLSPLGATAAALAYPTMSQVLQLGRLGESDALLALCLSAALFTWHVGYSCHGNPRGAWCAGYACAALAALVKGPQGPVYFVAATGVYLSMHRDWRFLFSRWHAFGAVLFLAIVGAWQAPFALRIDAAAAQAVWSEGGELGKRFAYHGLAATLRHWAAYPFELFACMLPWSFMLPPLATRWFRRQVGQAAPMVSFLITACVVALPSCWLPAETRPRYFMGLYPCVAALCGAAITRSQESIELGWWPRSWERYLQAATLLIAGTTAGVIVARLVPLGRLSDCLSWEVVVMVSAGGCLAAWTIHDSRRHRGLRRAGLAAAAVAGFWGLISTGIVLTAQQRSSNDPANEIAHVRELIPRGETLVSFRPIHHLFAYYYRQPIRVQMVAHDRAPADFAGTYFCYSVAHDTPPVEMPFPWEQVAEISCERARTSDATTKVVVGRALASKSSTAAPQARRPLPSLDLGAER